MIVHICILVMKTNRYHHKCQFSVHNSETEKSLRDFLPRQVLRLTFKSKWVGETDYFLPSPLSPALHPNHLLTAANVTARRFIYLIK